MKTFILFLKDHKRWFPLVPCLALMLGMWLNRTSLIYFYLPPIFPVALCDLVFAALALAVLACIFQETRCPSLVKARVDRAFRQSGLKNSVRDHPYLVKISSDPAKKGGWKYTIRNRGVSIPDMEKKIDNLQRELGWIYEMLYSPKTEYTYIFLLPGKSPSPPITPSAEDNEF